MRKKKGFSYMMLTNEAFDYMIDRSDKCLPKIEIIRSGTNMVPT